MPVHSKVGLGTRNFVLLGLHPGVDPAKANLANAERKTCGIIAFFTAFRELVFSLFSELAFAELRNHPRPSLYLSYRRRSKEHDSTQTRRRRRNAPTSRTLRGARRWWGCAHRASPIRTLGPPHREDPPCECSRPCCHRSTPISRCPSFGEGQCGSFPQ